MYRNFIDYPTIVDKTPEVKDKEKVTTPTFIQKHKTAILVAGVVIVAFLLLAPDAYLRRYVPFVK